MNFIKQINFKAILIIFIAWFALYIVLAFLNGLGFNTSEQNVMNVIFKCMAPISRLNKDPTWVIFVLDGIIISFLINLIFVSTRFWKILFLSILLVIVSFPFYLKSPKIKGCNELNGQWNYMTEDCYDHKNEKMINLE